MNAALELVEAARQTRDLIRRAGRETPGEARMGLGGLWQADVELGDEPATEVGHLGKRVSAPALVRHFDRLFRVDARIRRVIAPRWMSDQCAKRRHCQRRHEKGAKLR